jgi:hypothetical protein
MIPVLLGLWFCCSLHFARRAPVALYAGLFLLTYTQGFIFPWLFTSYGVSSEVLRPLLFTKDLTLIALMVVAISDLLATRASLPAPLPLLVWFVAYGSLRASVDMVSGEAETTAILKYMRELLFPLEALLPAFWLARTRPVETECLVRTLLTMIAALAALGLALHAILGPSYWLEHANIAEFNVAVGKADEENVIADLGVSGSSVGREGYDLYAALGLRVFGTFGEPLAFAHTVAAALGCFIIAQLRRPAHRIVGSAVLGTALLLTFTRSGWILATVVVLYGAAKRRHGKLLFAMSLVLVTLLFIIPDLQTFLLETLGAVGAGSEDQHAQGVTLLYTTGLTDPQNLFGKGIGVRDIPESGYAWMLEQGGLPLVVMFVAFLIRSVRELGRSGVSAYERMVSLAAAGLCLGWLIDLHFAEYPFSFTTSLFAWTLVGIAYGGIRPSHEATAA